MKRSLKNKLWTIHQLCERYKTKGYYTGPDDRIGIDTKHHVLWFQFKACEGYVQVGVTNTSQGREYHKLP